MQGRIGGDKAELRNRLLERRRALAGKPEKSARIAEKLFAGKDFAEARSIFVYVSKSDEVDTAGIISRALESGKRMFVPKVTDKMKKEMRFYELYDTSELAPGCFGCLEPSGETKAADEADFRDGLCIVPALACDKFGYRLGYGAGYYDRFLAASGMKTVCLCFEDMTVERLPRDGHDIMMDKVITED